MLSSDIAATVIYSRYQLTFDYSNQIWNWNRIFDLIVFRSDWAFDFPSFVELLRPDGACLVPLIFPVESMVLSSISTFPSEDPNIQPMLMMLFAVPCFLKCDLSIIFPRFTLNSLISLHKWTNLCIVEKHYLTFRFLIQLIAWWTKNVLSFTIPTDGCCTHICGNSSTWSSFINVWRPIGVK